MARVVEREGVMRAAGRIEGGRGDGGGDGGGSGHLRACAGTRGHARCRIRPLYRDARRAALSAVIFGSNFGANTACIGSLG
eukprot:1981874-Prymnesium_polylepis.1